MQLDLRVMDLLASKICHDLISPVSAINNGVELIEDIGQSVMDDALKLIADSAAQSSRRLKLFRIAYGRAGSEENLPLKEVRQTLLNYMSFGKVSLDWGFDVIPDGLLDTKGMLKVLVNLLIMAEEILPYGGSVILRQSHDMAQADSQKKSYACLLGVQGRGIKISDSYHVALDGSVDLDALTPRTIQPYITGRLAAHFGLEISWRQMTDEHLDIQISREDLSSDDKCVG